MSEYGESAGLAIGLALAAVVGACFIGLLLGVTWRVAAWVVG